MAFQPCPLTAEIRVQGTLNGQQVENVFHARVSATPTHADLDTIAGDIQSWVVGSYTTILSSNVQFTQIIVTDLNVEGGGQVIHVISPPVPGSVDAPVKTNQDTLAVSWRTGKAGRSFRGRTFILAVPTNDYAGDNPNMVSNAYAALVIGVFQGLHDAMVTATFPLGVLSRFHGVDVNHKPIPRATGLLTDITSVTLVNQIVDSQNRRLPGRGL